MATPVTIDPTTPAGNEPLKRGPSRFMEIKDAILKILFGQQELTTEHFGSPFDFADIPNGMLEVNADPTTDLGIATKHYVDSTGVTSVTDVTGDGNNYTGTLPAGFTVDATLPKLWVVRNGATANLGPMTLTLGAVVAPVDHMLAGSDLAAGDFAANTTYLLFYDPEAPAHFHLMGFFGGTLAADPTEALGAATKQYVDSEITLVARQQMNVGPVSVLRTDTLVFSTTVNIPDDGNPYLIHADWLAWVVAAHPEITKVSISLWVSDQTNRWAVGGNWYSAGSNVTGTGGAIAAAGVSPVAYTHAVTPTVTLEVHAIFGGGPTLSVTVEPNAQSGDVSPATFPAGMPETYLTATLMRTHS